MNTEVIKNSFKKVKQDMLTMRAQILELHYENLKAQRHMLQELKEVSERIQQLEDSQ